MGWDGIGPEVGVAVCGVVVGRREGIPGLG